MTGFKLDATCANIMQHSPTCCTNERNMLAQHVACVCTGLKACVYTENTRDKWHIPRYSKKHCITTTYRIVRGMWFHSIARRIVDVTNVRAKNCWIDIRTNSKYISLKNTLLESSSQKTRSPIFPCPYSRASSSQVQLHLDTRFHGNSNSPLIRTKSDSLGFTSYIYCKFNFEKPEASITAMFCFPLSLHFPSDSSHGKRFHALFVRNSIPKCFARIYF